MKDIKGGFLQTVLSYKSSARLTLIIFLTTFIILIGTNGIQAETFTWSPHMEDSPTATLTVRVRIMDPETEETEEPEIKEPEFLLNRTAAVIRISYSPLVKSNLIGEQIQNNIILHWLEDAKSSEDILFKSGDLYRFGRDIFMNDNTNYESNSKNYHSHSRIPAEAVLMSRNSSGDYVSLQNYCFALGTEEESARVNFKIDESYLQEAQLLPGIYRGNIESNIPVQGRSPYILVHVENNFSAASADKFLNSESTDKIREYFTSRLNSVSRNSNIHNGPTKDEADLKTKQNNLQPVSDEQLQTNEDKISYTKSLYERDVDMLIGLIKDEFSSENYSDVRLKNILNSLYLNGYRVEIMTLAEAVRENTDRNMLGEEGELIEITVFEVYE